MIKTTKLLLSRLFCPRLFLVICLWNCGAATATQLSTLTDWYTAMDSANGKTIALFPNDISYLTPDKNSIRPEYMVWPAWQLMSSHYSWPVSTVAADTFYINLNVNAPSGSVLRITVGANTLDYTLPYTGVNKYQMGSLSLPSGTSTLTLSLVKGTGNSVSVGSLELIPSAAKASIDAQIVASQLRPSWMRFAPVGLMFQWGEWGENPNGSHESWPGAYAGVKWATFAQRVKDTGADFVVWSVNWDEYYVAAPIAAIDAVLPGRTTTKFGGHDYLMDIVTELHNRDLKVVFYYHNGVDQLSWWGPNYLNDLPNGNHAHKEHFMNRWMNIVSEMSNRYGTKLDGWMFDWTNSYFPGPFKMMADVARQGNPSRMITFNTASTPTLTPFQDYYMGEDYSGDPGTSTAFGSIPYDTLDGRYTAGPFANQQAFNCFPTENGGSWDGWGISRNVGVNVNISPKYWQGWFDNVATRAASTKQSMAFAVQMWEDGTITQATLNLFTTAAIKAHAITSIENDTSTNATYTGSGWYTGRSPYVYNGDYHETTLNGDYVQYAFTGIGVDYITTKGTAYGDADIYIDGIFQQTVSLYASSYSYSQVAYHNNSLPYGSHVVKIVKASGTSMPVDAFNVYAAARTENDTSTKATYTGSGWYTARSPYVYNGDYHDTTLNGDYVQYAFIGTGVDYITTKGTAYGKADIYIDGIFQQTINLYASSYSYSQVAYHNNSLPFGSHVVKIVKSSGTNMSVDAFRVHDSDVFVNDSDRSITYNGTSWNYSSNRNVGNYPNAGDYGNDVHYATANGDSMQVTFNGIGVDLVGPLSPTEGNIDIYIDGLLNATVSSYISSGNVAQQTIYSARNLSFGQHTLKAVKKDAFYMQIDELIVHH